MEEGEVRAVTKKKITVPCSVSRPKLISDLELYWLKVEIVSGDIQKMLYGIYGRAYLENHSAGS